MANDAARGIGIESPLDEKAASPRRHLLSRYVCGERPGLYGHRNSMGCPETAGQARMTELCWGLPPGSRSRVGGDGRAGPAVEAEGPFRLPWRARGDVTVPPLSTG